MLKCEKGDVQCPPVPYVRGPLLAPEAILLALHSGGLRGSAKESGESFNAAFLSLLNLYQRIETMAQKKLHL